MEKKIIIKKINSALKSLYTNEQDLISNKTKEETIVTHLVGYLRKLFRTDGWSVDVEYNRDGEDPKKNSNGKLIFPDIIIHHRLIDGPDRFSPIDNLVVMEVKAHWNKEDRNIDTQKLIDMKSRYGYQYSFRIELKESVAEII